jgi:hypothetical protein
VAGRGAEHLLGEQLAGATAVLRRDDRREMATTDVTEKLRGSRIDPRATALPWIVRT